ncbi:MAG: site-2 protease family protein [Ilumatobacteraceae bacterium]|jgi:membrane-associated protease RseP (regulator of RpoE activity)|nr:site-2 protease family protein [Ilumatobacteraceae bacterium]
MKVDKIKSELMAGGSVEELPDDELAGGWRGALGLAALAALLVWLAVVNIWWFVFVVGVLIAIFLHEVGHFATARWTGMKATQFFIGFGPRLWSFRRGETEYGVRALPLGAFVRIIGMNNMDDVAPEDEPRTYRSKSYPRRMLVITAGSVMHMILAVLLLFTVYLIDGETVQRPGAEITAVEPSGPAAAAGLRVGDVVLRVDDAEVSGSASLGEAIRANDPGDVVDVVVLRQGEEVTIAVGLGANTDEDSPLFGKPYVGVGSSNVWDTVDHSVLGAATNAVTDIGPTAWESARGVIKVLNPVTVFEHLAGTTDDISTRPTTLVGVTGLSDDVGDTQGFVGILYLLAVLNVFVGVFNMFPLLPLDGGHAAIATYERMRERNGVRYHADVSKMMPVAMTVMALLLFLFVSGLYLDITDPVG